MYSRDKCLPPSHYYEALQLHVSVSGLYTLVSTGIVDIDGALYQDDFDPFDPTGNLVVEVDNGCSNQHFRIDRVLQKKVKYILVVTTYASQRTGSFSVVATGVAKINFTRIGERESKSDGEDLTHLCRFDFSRHSTR